MTKEGCGFFFWIYSSGCLASCSNCVPFSLGWPFLLSWAILSTRFRSHVLHTNICIFICRLLLKYISFNITLAYLWCIEGVHLFWYPSHHLRNEAQFSSLLVRNFCSWPQVVAMSFRLRCGCNCIVE